MEKAKAMIDWIRRQKHVAHPLVLAIAVVALGGAWVLWNLVARAGDSRTRDFQPYPLQYVLAGDITPTLATVLPEGTEVVADRQANRVLVRGPAESQEIAQRVVKSLDQVDSAQPKASDAPGDEPVLKAYRCPPGKAEEVANALRAEFGSAAGARIVPEQRTSQVLVVASPAIHAQIAGRLAGTQATVVVPRSGQGRSPAGPGTAGSASPQATGPSDIQLRNSTAEQIEAVLVGALGSRLEAAPGATGDQAHYRLILRDNTWLDLAMDRRTNRVRVTGDGKAADSLVQLIRMMDSPRQSGDESTRLVPLTATKPADAQRAVEAIRTANMAREQGAAGDAGRSPLLGPMVSRLMQQDGKTGVQEKEKEPRRESEPAGKSDQPAGAKAPAGAGAPKGGAPLSQLPIGQEEAGGLVGTVQIEPLEGLDVLIIRGHLRDVEAVRKIIEEIEKLAKETEPEIKVHPVQFVDCQMMATLVYQVYQQVYLTRQGYVFITALVRPNALLLVGRKENVAKAIELATKLDGPVAPEAQTRVFFLKHATAGNVQTTLQYMYPTGQVGAGLPGALPGAAAAAGAVTGLAPQVRAIADFRTNALIVQASPRDMAEVEALIARLDTDETDSVNQIRLFQLKHILATNLASILDSAIRVQGVGTTGGVTGGMPGGMPGGVPGFGTPGGAVGTMARTGFGQRSATLQFVTIDARGQERLNSGILTDVQFTANAQNNTLMVSAPAKSMALIAGLIEQLDKPPAVQAEIKVFTIENGDAMTLATMLDQFFGTTAAAGGAAGGAAQQTVLTARETETSLVPLRFNVDVRTNSIIAAGTKSDLLVIEAIITRLKAEDIMNRRTKVYELKNRPASNIASAILQFLTNERSLETYQAGFVSASALLEREVVVVPETVANYLIVSATPRYFDKIDKLINELDKRPPMVMIQVLLAQIDLTDTDEFGVELGLQDAVLFHRGLPTPGFAFNNQPLGNNNAGPKDLGTQGLTNLGVGRTGGLGVGGLVLSASSESVNILVRALKENHRLEVLSCPKIQTLDNQTAYIQVGQLLPYVTGVSQNTFGQTNSVTLIESGLILGVTPRIAPDGMVVMEIDANNSAPGPESEGIPIFVSTNGAVVRQPKIDRTFAQTTVAASDGQTVVLGGLIQKTTNVTRVKIPYLGDVPFFGPLFRFDSSAINRRELLIIMTPRVVKSDEDAAAIRRTEAARMHWCLSDVIDVWGSEGGLRGRKDEWRDDETQTIYPDAQPGVPPQPVPANGAKKSEKTPTPAKMRVRLQEPPRPGDNLPPVPPDSDRPSGQMAPPGDAQSRSGRRPGSAPMAWSQPRPGPVTPARYDSEETAAVEERGGWGRPYWPRDPAPGYDPRQEPTADWSDTNPLRGQ